MRFPLEHQDLSKMSDHRQRNDVMKLWVSYAQTHAKDGNLEEARNTFHHIENKSKGLYDLLKDDDFLGKFFLAFARFELEHYRDKESAKQILLRGIQDTKDADGALLDYLKNMDGSSAEKSTKRSPLALTKNAVTSIHSSHEYSPGISSSSGPNKSPLEFSLSSGGNNFSQKKRSVEVGRSRSPKRHKPQNMINKPEIGMHVTVRPAVGVGVKANDSSSPKGKAAVVTATETGLHGKPPAPTSKKRSSITSRLARKGLTGAPKRVEADTTMALHDDVSTDDSDQESTCEEDTKVPSFKNMDLSYIWTWKPKGLTNTERQEVSMGGEHPTHGSGNSSNHSGAEAKLEENDTQSKKEKEALKKTSALKETEPSSSENAVACNNTTSTGQMKAVTSATSAVDGSLARKETLLAKANLEFLPLVHEDNILRIKTDSYVKLGVIGKGGSCKVYRALTKKCTVVAIKKVKLEGMTKKQIEGYANEISLLKRLKGNPSIIRMYDSELDLQRKSLFVVMELGEVDLNYVLQQRARAETSKSLDMNFIRLTWQQMLGAVHSIHEAKIIHSDLKPANFLFVRGALKLIDFGIAKAIANPEDTTKIVRESQIGTLNYMSPESILDTGEGGEAGPRMKIGRASDVWSLGCILYEMVYGTTPFASYHFIVKLQAIINEDHKIKFPDAGESGEAAIDAMKQCLRRRPEERPPIVGKNGLLNEHWFLHSKRKARK
jgi:hypothetical protein